MPWHVWRASRRYPSTYIKRTIRRFRARLTVMLGNFDSNSVIFWRKGGMVHNTNNKMEDVMGSIVGLDRVLLNVRHTSSSRIAPFIH